MCYLYKHNMAQYCSALLVYTQYGTVLLCATCIYTLWHSTALRYLYIHNMAQYCSALLVYTQYGTVLLCATCIYTLWHSTALHYLYMHKMAQYHSALLLHAWYGTVPFSVTRTCTSNALYYLHRPLTITKVRAIVKAPHSSCQCCEVHQEILWSCKQANTCKILGCHRGITEHTSLLGHNTVHCVTGCVVTNV